VCKDKKKYPADFRVELYFSNTVIANEVKAKELLEASKLVGEKKSSSASSASASASASS
jgi:hypothetical protein